MTDFDEVIQKILSIRYIDKDEHWLHKFWRGKSRPRMYFGGKVWYLSRLIMALTNPNYSEDLQANHHCNKEHCFNPEHLYMGTAQQNNDDYWGKT